MSDKLVMNETVLKQLLAKLENTPTRPDAQTMMHLLWQAAQEVLGGQATRHQPR